MNDDEEEQASDLEWRDALLLMVLLVDAISPGGSFLAKICSRKSSFGLHLLLLPETDPVGAKLIKLYPDTKLFHQ